jgi:hypothetical protein
LRFEHFNRLQTVLTKLVARHLREGISDPGEFIRVVTECEQVHIVTFRENYDAAMANGDYHKANIALVAWADIALETQHVLWSKKLRGKCVTPKSFARNRCKRREHVHNKNVRAGRAFHTPAWVRCRRRGHGGA